ncbi:MAG: hypothetical protein AAF431_06760 [Pseudomonadota bacterium]
MKRPLARLFSCLVVCTVSSHIGAEQIEHKVQYIELAAPLDRGQAQFSGMSWCQGQLVLLPEKPWFVDEDDVLVPTTAAKAYVYSLEVAQLDAYLEATNKPEPLEATPIPLLENGVRDQLHEFDGYEAIACQDESVWLAIETELTETEYETNLVQANWVLQGGQAALSIDPETLRKVPSQSGVRNYSDETILLNGEQLITIHEVNRHGDHAAPYAHRIHTQGEQRDTIAFPRIAYRITDASSIDEDGYFWTINYLWSKEQDRFTPLDPLFARYPRGATHRQEPTVERLVQFRLESDSISRVERAPIQLQLTKEDGRNWEGIVRYKDLGLLLVTDMHPQTILGFVPFRQGL